ncbi:MAG: hypothetical protein LBT23_06875, partial [Synergistaceae bacterium]|nr:hypothetical protein [Synergistaceae bacterium]
MMQWWADYLDGLRKNNPVAGATGGCRDITLQGLVFVTSNNIACKKMKINRATVWVTPGGCPSFFVPKNRLKYRLQSLPLGYPIKNTKKLSGYHSRARYRVKWFHLQCIH